MRCQTPPNALVSPFFQSHLHGASGVWAVPAAMVSAVHYPLVFTELPEYALFSNQPPLAAKLLVFAA